MKRLLKSRVVVPLLVVCILVAALYFSTFRGKKLVTNLNDIEYVIVDCHDSQWITSYKLVPQKDMKVIKRLARAVNHLRRGPPIKWTGQEFLLFKMKDGQVVTVPMVIMLDEKDVYVPRARFSRTLYRILQTIREKEIGLTRGDSIPEFEVEKIRIHYIDGSTIELETTSLRFQRIMEVAESLLGCIEPRCLRVHDPYYDGKLPDSLHQPQGAVFEMTLEKPIPMYRFIAPDRSGKSPTEYVEFSSTRIFIFKAELPAPWSKGEFMLLDALTVAFNSKEQVNRWYLYEPPFLKTDPNPRKVYKELCEEAEKIKSQ